MVNVTPAEHQLVHRWEHVSTLLLAFSSKYHCAKVQPLLERLQHVYQLDENLHEFRSSPTLAHRSERENCGQMAAESFVLQLFNTKQRCKTAWHDL